jgi:hypothetical protein
MNVLSACLVSCVWLKALPPGGLSLDRWQCALSFLINFDGLLSATHIAGVYSVLLVHTGADTPLPRGNL